MPWQPEFCGTTTLPSLSGPGQLPANWFQAFWKCTSKSLIAWKSRRIASKSWRYKDCFMFQFKPDGSGGWNFSCQHGPDECTGNLYQACLLHYLQNSNRLQVEVIHCLMTSSEPHLATEKVTLNSPKLEHCYLLNLHQYLISFQCMSELNINDPSYDTIEKCHLSNFAENLLHDFGLETANLKPPHYFIPWITFDQASYHYCFCMKTSVQY